MPAFYNLAPERISPQQRQYNDLPHTVYLAWFGPGIVKVGISSVERRIDRWLEQGAIAATAVFLASNAYAARRVEATLSSEMGFREVVRAAEKFRNLFPAPNLDLALTELAEAKWSIAQTMPIKVEESDPFIGTARYFASSFPEREPTDLSTARPLTISGRGYGAVGDFLIVQQAENFFSVRMKSLIAHMISVSDTVVPNTTSEHVQNRLL